MASGTAKIYVPRLRYIFNFGRWYDTDRTLPLLQYLNAVGVAPPVLAGEPEIVERLKSSRLRYKAVTDLPHDYDLMLSPGVGYVPFERYWLERSMEAGKINVQCFYPPVINGSSNLQNLPRRTKFMHAVCVGCEKTINDLRSINREVVYVLTGMPSWDGFSTVEFQAQAAHIRQSYGDKLLVIGVSCLVPEETAYYRRVIAQAESIGFKVILQVHPGKEDKLCGSLRPYANPGVERHCLFAAASHVIIFVQSLMGPECLFLNRRVATKPLGLHYHGWNHHAWIDDPAEWRAWARPLYGDNFLSMMPLIHDEQSLTRFLGDTSAVTSKDRADRLLGFPNVRSFTEHTFRMLDTWFGPENRDNVAAILKKREVCSGQKIDYSFWDIRPDWNQFRGVRDLEVFIAVGIHLIKEGRHSDALRYLQRAEMYSGTEHFAYVEYLKSACYAALGRLDEAEKSIYKSVFVRPERPEYRQLKNQIAAAAKAMPRAPEAVCTRS